MLTPEQIDAIERDAGTGLTVSEIATKHKIAYETAKRYAPNAAASKKGRKVLGGGEQARFEERGEPVFGYDCGVA